MHYLMLSTFSYLRFDALDDVTTVPALACGGLPSALDTKLLRGENPELASESALPRLPKTMHNVMKIISSKGYDMLGNIVNGLNLYHWVCPSM